MCAKWIQFHFWLLKLEKMKRKREKKKKERRHIPEKVSVINCDLLWSPSHHHCNKRMHSWRDKDCKRKPADFSIVTYRTGVCQSYASTQDVGWKHIKERIHTCHLTHSQCLSRHLRNCRSAACTVWQEAVAKHIRFSKSTWRASQDNLEGWCPVRSSWQGSKVVWFSSQ